MAIDDLALVHAPSVFGFRGRPTLWGPISDLIPSTTIFDMYPIGFSTIAEYLQKKGLRVRIINLAVRMLQDSDFNVEEFIESIKASAFGIDLHWLPHAHGAIEIARVIKKIHPCSPVIMGGLSSSYFHKELITYPQVDFILRGDSTEEPLGRLMECIESGAHRNDLARIPNLTWKDRGGVVHINPLSYIPSDLNGILIDHSVAVRSAFRDKNLSNYLPFLRWRKFPITAALSCKGCTRNCVICGGSRFAYREYYGRKKPAFRSPELLAKDIRRITQYSRGPIFVLGDIRQAGMHYAKEFIRILQGIRSQIIFEFFWPVDRNFIEEIAGAVRNFFVQFSPESHDPYVLRYSNKAFTHESIESSIRNILAAGCRRLDVFFMSGMPGQTYGSVLKSMEYCGKLLHIFNGDPRLRFFISPLAPFLDPGSLAYERSAYYGYRKFYTTLAEHHDALVAPSWKYVLGYETKWMNRAQIVDSTYQAALQLNRLKAEYGQMEKDASQLMEERILKAIDLMKYIDNLVAGEENGHFLQKLVKIKSEIEEVNNSTVCIKEELDLPIGGRLPVKLLRTAGMLISDNVKNAWKRNSK